MKETCHYKNTHILSGKTNTEIRADQPLSCDARDLTPKLNVGEDMDAAGPD